MGCMKKISLPFIVNSLLSFAILTPLLALLFGGRGLSFKSSLLLAVPLSVTASLSAGVLLTALSGKKSPFDAHSPYMLKLNTYADDEISDLFHAFFTKENKCASVDGKHMIVKDEEKTEDYFLAFLPEDVTGNELALIALSRPKKYKSLPFCVISARFTPSAEKYAKKEGFRLVDEKELIPALLRSGVLKKDVKQGLITRLTGLFNPALGLKAIFYGAFVAILSPLVGYGAYYLFFGIFGVVYGMTAILLDKLLKRKKQN